MSLDIQKHVLSNSIDKAHRLADTQAYIIDRDSLRVIAQACITFENEGIDTRQAKQVAHSKTCWTCTGDNDGEIWWRWCIHQKSDMETHQPLGGGRNCRSPFYYRGRSTLNNRQLFVTGTDMDFGPIKRPQIKVA